MSMKDDTVEQVVETVATIPKSGTFEKISPEEDARRKKLLEEASKKVDRSNLDKIRAKVEKFSNKKGSVSIKKEKKEVPLIKKVEKELKVTKKKPKKSKKVVKKSKKTKKSKKSVKKTEKVVEKVDKPMTEKVEKVPEKVEKVPEKVEKVEVPKSLKEDLDECLAFLSESVVKRESTPKEVDLDTIFLITPFARKDVKIKKKEKHIEKFKFLKSDLDVLIVDRDSKFFKQTFELILNTWQDLDLKIKPIQGGSLYARIFDGILGEIYKDRKYYLFKTLNYMVGVDGKKLELCVFEYPMDIDENVYYVLLEIDKTSNEFTIERMVFINISVVHS